MNSSMTGREDRDRRDEHRGAPLGRGLAQVVAPCIAQVLAECPQRAGEVGAALGPGREQLVRAGRVRLRRELGSPLERFVFGTPLRTHASTSSSSSTIDAAAAVDDPLRAPGPGPRRFGD